MNYLIYLKNVKKILHDTQFSNIKKLSNPKLFQYIFKDIFFKVKIKDFVEIVLYILMFIVTHSNIFMDDEGVEHNNKTSIINISLFAPQASKMVFDKFIQNSTIILNEEAKDNSENEAEEVEAVSFSFVKNNIIDNFLGRKLEDKI